MWFMESLVISTGKSHCWRNNDNEIGMSKQNKCFSAVYGPQADCLYLNEELILTILRETGPFQAQVMCSCVEILMQDQEPDQTCPRGNSSVFGRNALYVTSNFTRRNSLE